MPRHELSDFRNEAATPDAPLDKTFSVKLGVSRLDRITRNAQRSGKSA
nr:hypothetical protein [Tsuneonella flava]